MLCSVIIPCYNSEDTIFRAINSALYQPGIDIEVVVVDDFSSDKTEDVLAFYSDYPQVKIAKNSANLGVAATRNRALEIADGDWILLLDADDELPIGSIAQLINYAVLNKADLVAGNVSIIKDNGSEEKLLPENDVNMELYDRDILIQEFLKENWPGSPCLRLGLLKPIFRNSFLKSENIKYNEDLRFNEDFELVARCLIHKGRFLIHKNVAYTYHRGGGLTSKSSLTQLVYIKRANDLLMELAIKEYNTIMPVLRLRNRHIRIQQERKTVALISKGRFLEAYRGSSGGIYLVFLFMTGVLRKITQKMSVG